MRTMTALFVMPGLASSVPGLIAIGNLLPVVIMLV